jgi:hypothetical protein
MRAFRFLNVGVFSIVLASSAFLCAQEPKQEEPKQTEPRQAEPRQAEPRQAEPRQTEPRPESRQDETKPSKQEKQEQQRQDRQSRDQMRPGNQEHAQQQGHARPAGRSAHIPDERFHAQFGRAHTFPVQRTTVVEGQQGFVYGGYTFVLVDPWPADWAYTDDCYIDYVDGDYFLFDLLHPGMRIALFVVE